MSTTKQPSALDFEQVLRASFNDVDSTFSTNGFVAGKVGHKVVMAISTTSVANDTETYSFSDTGTLLYQIRVVYTSGTREVLVSAERIS